MKVTIEIVTEEINRIQVCGQCFSFNKNNELTARCEHFDSSLALIFQPPEFKGRFLCCPLCLRACNQDRS